MGQKTEGYFTGLKGELCQFWSIMVNDGRFRLASIDLSPFKSKTICHKPMSYRVRQQNFHTLILGPQFSAAETTKLQFGMK